MAADWSRKIPKQNPIESEEGGFRGIEKKESDNKKKYCLFGMILIIVIVIVVFVVFFLK